MQAGLDGCELSHATGALAAVALQLLQITQRPVRKLCSDEGGCAGVGAPNVIPDSVQLSGTIRALTNTRFGELRTRVVEVRY